MITNGKNGSSLDSLFEEFPFKEDNSHHDRFSLTDTYSPSNRDQNLSYVLTQWHAIADELNGNERPHKKIVNSFFRRIRQAWTGEIAIPETPRDRVKKYEQLTHQIVKKTKAFYENLCAEQKALDTFMEDIIDRQEQLVKYNNKLQDAHKKHQQEYQETLQQLNKMLIGDEKHASQWKQYHRLDRELNKYKQQALLVADKLNTTKDQSEIVQKITTAIDQAAMYTGLASQRASDTLDFFMQIKPSIITYIETGKIAHNLEKNLADLNANTKVVIGLCAKSAPLLSAAYAETACRPGLSAHLSGILDAHAQMTDTMMQKGTAKVFNECDRYLERTGVPYGGTNGTQQK